MLLNRFFIIKTSQLKNAISVLSKNTFQQDQKQNMSDKNTNSKPTSPASSSGSKLAHPSPLLLHSSMGRALSGIDTVQSFRLGNSQGITMTTSNPASALTSPNQQAVRAGSTGQLNNSGNNISINLGSSTMINNNNLRPSALAAASNTSITSPLTSNTSFGKGHSKWNKAKAALRAVTAFGSAGSFAAVASSGSAGNLKKSLSPDKSNNNPLRTPTPGSPHFPGPASFMQSAAAELFHDADIVTDLFSDGAGIRESSGATNQQKSSNSTSKSGSPVKNTSKNDPTYEVANNIAQEFVRNASMRFFGGSSTNVFGDPSSAAAATSNNNNNDANSAAMFSGGDFMRTLSFENLRAAKPPQGLDPQQLSRPSTSQTAKRRTSSSSNAVHENDDDDDESSSSSSSEEEEEDPGSIQNVKKGSSSSTSMKKKNSREPFPSSSTTSLQRTRSTRTRNNEPLDEEEHEMKTVRLQQNEEEEDDYFNSGKNQNSEQFDSPSASSPTKKNSNNSNTKSNKKSKNRFENDANEDKFEGYINRAERERKDHFWVVSDDLDEGVLMKMFENADELVEYFKVSERRKFVKALNKKHYQKYGNQYNASQNNEKDEDAEDIEKVLEREIDDYVNLPPEEKLHLRESIEYEQQLRQLNTFVWIDVQSQDPLAALKVMQLFPFIRRETFKETTFRDEPFQVFQHNDVYDYYYCQLSCPGHKIAQRKRKQQLMAQMKRKKEQEEKLQQENSPNSPSSFAASPANASPKKADDDKNQAASSPQHAAASILADDDEIARQNQEAAIENSCGPYIARCCKSNRTKVSIIVASSLVLTFHVEPFRGLGSFLKQVHNQVARPRDNLQQMLWTATSKYFSEFFGNSNNKKYQNQQHQDNNVDDDGVQEGFAFASPTHPTGSRTSATTSGTYDFLTVPKNASGNDISGDDDSRTPDGGARTRRGSTMTHYHNNNNNINNMSTASRKSSFMMDRADTSEMHQQSSVVEWGTVSKGGSATAPIMSLSQQDDSVKGSFDRAMQQRKKALSVAEARKPAIPTTGDITLQIPSPISPNKNRTAVSFPEQQHQQQQSEEDKKLQNALRQAMGQDPSTTGGASIDNSASPKAPLVSVPDTLGHHRAFRKAHRMVDAAFDDDDLHHASEGHFANIGADGSTSVFRPRSNTTMTSASKPSTTRLSEYYFQQHEMRRQQQQQQQQMQQNSSPDNDTSETAIPSPTSPNGTATLPNTSNIANNNSEYDDPSADGFVPKIPLTVLLESFGSGSLPNLPRMTSGWILASLIQLVVENSIPDLTGASDAVSEVEEQIFRTSVEIDDSTQVANVENMKLFQELVSRIGQVRRLTGELYTDFIQKSVLLQTILAPRYAAHQILWSKMYSRALLRQATVNLGRSLEQLDSIREHLTQCSTNVQGKVSIAQMEASIRMDAQSRRLSQVATVCLPLSLLTGLFGINCPVPFQSGDEGSDNGISDQKPFLVIMIVIAVWFTIAVLYIYRRSINWCCF